MDTTIISLLPSQTYMDTILTINIDIIKRKGIMLRKKNKRSNRFDSADYFK